MKKLELKHLAPYLPYELKMYHEDLKGTEIIPWELKPDGVEMAIDFQNRPVLKPLSDYSDLSGKAMNDLNCDVSNQITINEYATGYIGIGQVDYETILIMTENHIDMFKLIPNDLAIHINTLKND